MGVMMLKKKEIVLVMMMVIMILGAQVQAQSNDIEAHHRKKHRHCASKCALKCLFNFRLTPVTYMTCFSLCCLKCKIFPPDSVYSCTSACAHSKALTLCNNVEEAEDVEGYVESCYDKCSNKH